MSAALALVANALERLAIRVENTFNADATESAEAPADGDALMEYAQQCFEVLNDPIVAAAMLDEQGRDAEAERRGAVKALRAEAARGRDAAGAFSDPDPDRRHDGFRLLMRTADAIDAQADAIESGVVTLP